MIAFTVQDVFVIRGRGPVVTRSEQSAKEARDHRDLFRTGDVVECGDLVATITGIESWAVPNAPQQAFLLRGVEREQLAAGQTWTKVITLCDGEHAERTAEFRLVMLDTTSLDAVADLCLECAIATLGGWLVNPEDITGYEVRKL